MFNLKIKSTTETLMSVLDLLSTHIEIVRHEIKKVSQVLL